MSIRVRGTITIQRKTGARGSFNVGDLNTEIGEFEVKDSLIEEFEPGKYHGDFLIKWIAPDSFTWRGRVFVKNKATLEEILIDEADETAPAPSSPPEPDPIEQQASHAASQQTAAVAVSVSAPATAPAIAPANDTATSSARSSRSAHADAADITAATSAAGKAAPVTATATAAGITADGALFGDEIYALLLNKELIKLDPSVDREMFRQQRDRLRNLGYAFDPKSQSWSVKSSQEAVPA